MELFQPNEKHQGWLTLPSQKVDAPLAIILFKGCPASDTKYELLILCFRFIRPLYDTVSLLSADSVRRHEPRRFSR